jgi:hypothetical protein
MSVATPDLGLVRAALEEACRDCIDGSPPGPMLYRRIRRVAEARLRRLGGRGITGWTIEVSAGATPDEVLVDLRIQTPQRVESVRMSLSMR